MKEYRKFHSKFYALLLCGLSLLLPACAVHYHDARTGTDHLWGFGHLKTRASAPEGDVKAVMMGIQTFGAGVSIGGSNPGIMAGYQGTSVLTAVCADAALIVEGPSADPFLFEIRSISPDREEANPRQQNNNP